MKCRHFFSFVLVLFLSFFFGSFIITSDTFAIDYDLDIVNGTSTILCTGNNISSTPSGVPFCDDVKSVTFSTDFAFNGSIRPSFVTDTSSSSNCSSQSSSVIYLPFNFSSSLTLSNLSHVCGISFGNSFSLNGSTSHWSVTLSTDDSSTCPPSPSGDYEITQNGIYDVTSYATATVNVPAEVIQGDYHDDLVNINQSIIVCGAILLVLYFFYCIYRLIIKNSGVH